MGLFQVLFFIPIWGSLLWSQPPLPRELAQTQSSSNQPTIPKGTSPAIPLPGPSSRSVSPPAPMTVPGTGGPVSQTVPGTSLSNPARTVQTPLPSPASGNGPPPPAPGNQTASPPAIPQEEGKPNLSAPRQPGTPPENRVPSPLRQTGPAVRRGEVSFNFDDADVYSVIQTIFGGVLKFNYIIDPKVKGRVNFRSVAPVAKEDVLPLMEVILRLNTNVNR